MVAGRTAYLAARVVDGVADQALTGKAILVEGARIVGVVDRAAVPSDATLRDLGDCTVLPGLIDCHAHLFWDASGSPQAVVESRARELTALSMAQHARQHLEAGVTTVRDLGALGGLNIALQQAVDAGYVPGPRVVAAGEPVCMTGGHGWFMGREADGPDEVRKAVRAQIKAGAGCIKLMASGGIYGHGEAPSSPQLTYAELAAGVEEAHKAGRLTTAHAYGPPSIRQAVEAGIDCVEHGSFLDEPTAALMAERGVSLVPTLSVYEAMAIRAREPGTPDFIREKTPGVLAASRGVVRIALAAGVRLAAGTDCGSPGHPHGTVADEVRYLAHAGHTTMGALQAATSHAAAVIGLGSTIGRLAEGYAADLLAVHGNPLADLAALRAVRLVVRAGMEVVDRPVAQRA